MRNCHEPFIKRSLNTFASADPVDTIQLPAIVISLLLHCSTQQLAVSYKIISQVHPVCGHSLHRGRPVREFRRSEARRLPRIRVADKAPMLVLNFNIKWQ